MRKIAALFAFLAVALLAVPAAADCPVVYSLDDPPCIPDCVPVAVGQPEHWMRFYGDGSEKEWDVQTYINCDGTTAAVVSNVTYHCVVGAPTCQAAVPVLTE